MRHAFRALVAAGLAAAAATAQAQPADKVSDGVVKFGLLLDMSSLYADITGQGSVTAARMAIEDYGAKVLGRPVEVIFADHQNKPDIAASLAREWFDTQTVDASLDVAASATALAAVEIAKGKNRIVVMSGPGAARLTNEACSPVSVHYAYDTYSLAHTTGGATVKQGGDTWYIVGADYSFGRTIAKDITDVVTAAGGKVLGTVFHPLGTTDYSSYILQAQTSGAKIIAFANAGGDMINSLKSAAEFGLTISGKQRVTGLLVFITDIHAVGLQTTQGLVLEDDFYWDFDDQTRAFSERFFKRMGKMPVMVHAANYSAVTNYLKAIEAVGTDDADTVMAYLRKTPIHDFYSRNGFLREDGLLIHDLYLMQVKSPAESKKPWDYYKLLKVIPGKDAFRPLSESACPLVKKG